MHLVIVSGLSGSGKSTALNSLEDAGYNCIDNLPVSLLSTLIEKIQARNDPDQQNFAIGIDVRDAWKDLGMFPEIINTLKTLNLPYSVLFLMTNINTIIQRFSETRRKHPLSDKYTNLSEAIHAEQDLLEPMRDNADLIVDTSMLNVHQLRELVKDRISEAHSTGMAILFESFGFKYGAPNNADLVFDARCLANPHWHVDLRRLSGKDREVIEFLETNKQVQSMFTDIQHFLEKWLPQYQINNRSYITIAIGCTGGQHRSVYLSEKLQQHFSHRLENVQVRHRELI